MKIMATFDRYLGRASNIWTFASPVIPGAVGAVVTGRLSTGVAWISQFEWFGWWSAALIGFFFTSAAWAFVAIARERLSARRAMDKWSESVDAVNPLDNQFHKNRIKISDLVHPVTNRISHKRFTDCELIGPANILIMDKVNLTGINFANCDMIPTKENLFIRNAIDLEDTHIHGGMIAYATMFIHPSILELLERDQSQGIYYPTLTGNSMIDARMPDITARAPGGPENRRSP